MSFARYPECKDSGVEWLGDVPTHWDVQRLKRICEVFPSNVDKKAHEGEESIRLCNYTDVYYNDKITSDMSFMEATASAAQIQKFTLRAGDTIVTKDSETADDIAISAHVPDDLPGVVCGYHLSMIRPNAGTDGLFVKRLFDSAYARACFEISANGLTRVGLSQYSLDNIALPFPPGDEQRVIAAFLDREAAKIDALVAEQENLIALLKEKRQGVISHAVTKGLDPAVPMKDSGIEWLGQVPAHWDVKRLKFVLDEIKAGPFGSSLTKDMYVSAGFRVYGQEQVIPNDFSVGDYYIGEEKYKELGQYKISTGDILISCVGTFGKIAIVPPEIEPGIINPRLMRLRCSPAVKPEYLATVLRSAVVFEQFSLLSRGGTMDVINIGTLSDIVLPVPNVGEQEAIFQFVEGETNKLDELNAEAQRAIELLQERRSALISAAVTGKIDVRRPPTVPVSLETSCA